MTNFAISYGLSLYSLCHDENITDTAKKNLSLISAVLRENPEYIKLMDSPMISVNERCSLIDTAFSDSINFYILNFLKLLVQKMAFYKFFECEKAFVKQYNSDNNIETAVAVTAVPLSDELKERLTKKLSLMINKTVVLEQKVDKTLIGGLVVRFANTQIDASVKTRLAAVKDQISGRMVR